MTNETLPEAPASATVKIKSKNGFEYLFTIRDVQASKLLDKLALFEDLILDREYTPLAQGNGFSKAPVATKTCTVHSVEMKEKTSKRTGKTYFSHWEGTYPNLGEQCFGDGFKGQKEIPTRQVSEEDYGP